MDVMDNGTEGHVEKEGERTDLESDEDDITNDAWQLEVVDIDDVDQKTKGEGDGVDESQV